MNNFELLKQKLKDNHIPHNLIELDVKTLSVDEHVKVANIEYKEGVSTLLFRTKEGKYYAVLRRDDRKIDNKKLKEIINIKIFFCDSEDLNKLNIEKGLTAPLILNDIQKNLHINILVDEKILEVENIVCGSASPKHALKISANNLLKNIGEHKIVDVTIPNIERSGNIEIINKNIKKLNMKKVILTGDRPTGKLHIGHLIGSLKNRVKMQQEYDEYILIANVQAFTDNYENPEKVKNSVFDLLADYYAVGIDFNVAKVIIQSEIPEIHEIFLYLANFATIQQIAHNPTIKTEIAEKKFGESTPLGFYMYPIHQIADIACVKANVIPVGPDQVPIVEDCREVIRKFNRAYKTDVLVEPEALVGISKNVPGIDGNVKMGKSLNNAIYLSDTAEELRKKVFSIKTDPNRIHPTDPGQVEGNTVFTYHDIFNDNKEEVEDLKKRYREGTVGDVEVKEKLYIAMNNILEPIRERRKEGESKISELLEIAKANSLEARKIARKVADSMKEAMLLKY